MNGFRRPQAKAESSGQRLRALHFGHGALQQLLEPLHHIYL